MSTWVSKATLDDLVGSDTAETLCREYGGIPFYIPRKVTPGKGLAKTIGFGCACAMCEAFGGEYITLPISRPESLKKQILTLLNKGKIASDIARELHTTERYVRRVISKDLHKKNWLTLI